MWYIERLGVRDIASILSERQSLLHDRHSNVLHYIVVWLRNSETNETVRLTSEGSFVEFEKTMESYSPYGYVPPKVFSDGSLGRNTVFVAVDELSVKFLDYVSKVETVTLDAGDSLVAYIDSLKHWVTLWNTDGTIVELCGSGGEFACTLFQMICFLGFGWRDDCFYMRNGPKFIGHGACVEFKDVQKARSLLAKAAILGYDPLQKRIDVRRGWV